MYTNDDQTVLLCVVMQTMSDERADQLEKRFGRFFSRTEATIEYPVSCDTHAFDVFTDEFPSAPTEVYMASLVTMPYGVESFKPHSESGDGTEQSQWTPEIGWEHFYRV